MGSNNLFDFTFRKESMRNISIIILVLSMHSAIGQKVQPSIIDKPKNMDLVRVKLINPTSYKIDTLIFCKTLFKSLANNDSIEFFQIENVVSENIVARK